MINFKNIFEDIYLDINKTLHFLDFYSYQYISEYVNSTTGFNKLCLHGETYVYVYFHLSINFVCLGQFRRTNTYINSKLKVNDNENSLDSHITYS